MLVPVCAACDGSRRSPRAAGCAAVAVDCSSTVCVSVVVVDLLGGWKTMGWFRGACPAIGSC